jgi:hypothetical protein
MMQVKLVRIDHILLTRLTTEATAGLVGMLLTVSELGTAEFPIRITVRTHRALPSLWRLAREAMFTDDAFRVARQNMRATCVI